MKPERGTRIVRRMSVAIVALVLAIAGTIVSAWAIAYWPKEFSSASGSFWSASKGPAWLYQTENHWGATRLTGQRVSAWSLVANDNMAVVPPPSWSLMTGDAVTPAQFHELEEQAFGWPMRCLCVHQLSNANSQWITGGKPTGKPNPTRPWLGMPIYLPLDVHWLGFTIDTLVNLTWTLPIAVLLIWVAGPVLTLRTRLRTRRGHCPRCGYDVKGGFDSGCPECGWNRPFEAERPRP